MNEKKAEIIRKKLISVVEELKKYGASDVDITLLVNAALRESFFVPVSILSNRRISSFEAIVKFLREEGLTISEIGKLTGRQAAPIHVTYKNAKLKMPFAFANVHSKYSFPVKVLQDRRFSVLEHVVSHLKEAYGLSFTAIGEILNRDQRTIWTVYNRMKKKLKKSPGKKK